jgi:hypothetical protein
MAPVADAAPRAYAHRVRRRKRQTRAFRWFERAALGAVMGGIAFVLERRLLRSRGKGKAPKEDPSDLELAVPAQDVDDQTGR